MATTLQKALYSLLSIVGGVLFLGAGYKLLTKKKVLPGETDHTRLLRIFTGLGALLIASNAFVYFFAHRPHNNKKDELVKLISDNQEHFFGRVTDGTTNVTLSKEVATKAVDACEFSTSDLDKAITQVKADKHDDDEYKKLYAELGKAYTAGTVWRRNDDPDATSLGYY
jgi:hypothetical protein